MSRESYASKYYRSHTLFQRLRALRGVGSTSRRPPDPVPVSGQGGQASHRSGQWARLLTPKLAIASRRVPEEIPIPPGWGLVLRAL